MVAGDYCYYYYYDYDYDYYYCYYYYDNYYCCYYYHYYYYIVPGIQNNTSLSKSCNLLVIISPRFPDALAD